MQSDRESERIADAPQGGTFPTASRNQEKQQPTMAGELTSHVTGFPTTLLGGRDDHPCFPGETT